MGWMDLIVARTNPQTLLTITISSLNLLDYNEANQTCHIEVVCSKGTYIRTLAEDIGRALHSGGYLVSLRRLAVQPFTESMMIPLALLLSLRPETVLQENVLPVDAALQSLPAIRLSQNETQRLFYGQAVETDKADGDLVRLLESRGEFLGIGQIKSGLVVSKRLLARESSM